MRGQLSICWLRRDLRLEDNAALYHLLREKEQVQVLFIFDSNILSRIGDPFDKRVQFIYQTITGLKQCLRSLGSDLLVKTGKPVEVWQELINSLTIETVYSNCDYEPYARERDTAIASILAAKGIAFKSFKDHVVFEKGEVLKEDGSPYTVFTPYSRKWKQQLNASFYKEYPTVKYFNHFIKVEQELPLPALASLGFKPIAGGYPARLISDQLIRTYAEKRDYPALNGTSRLGLHLRFGTLSIRKLLAYALHRSETFVNELIWRDFYQQILWHFPQVAASAFKKEYDRIEWINDALLFKRWCTGATGYPLVDAGMRELNETGFMHNRVRMLTASFLTKHLLTDWRMGEAYFAEKLLDFDLAANNGGWQWAAGCGTDAAPYFRIFNPELQLKKFDPDLQYVRKWIPELGTADYPARVIDYDFARLRCISTYQKAIRQ